MTRSPLLLALLTLVPTLPSCRPAPSDAERRWEHGLKNTLPPGWTVVAVVGNPSENTFICWLSAPGEGGKDYRVEVRVQPGSHGGRDWAVLVHPPADPVPKKSVKFHVPDDGQGPLELATESRGRAAFAGEVRPLAEEAVRQVRGLDLFR